MNIAKIFKKHAANPHTTLKVGFAAAALASALTGFIPGTAEALILMGLGGGALATGRQENNTQTALTSGHNPAEIRREIVALEKELGLDPDPDFDAVPATSVLKYKNTKLMKTIGKNGLDGLRTFVERGGTFNPQAVNNYGCTEAMLTARYAGAEGLRTFVENGGTFNPQAVDNDGSTEAIYTACYAGAEGLRTFVERGGTFNPQAVTNDGWTEAMFTACYAGAEGLRTFVENGGLFNPQAVNNKDQTEGMFIVQYCGKEGLEMLNKHSIPPSVMRPAAAPSPLENH